MTITAQQIKDYCRELGFIKVGIVAAEPLHPEGEQLREWLARGYQGKMGYLERNAERSIDPGLILPSARSIICVAYNYYTPDKHIDSPEIGKISRYAWGDDYHDIIGDKLKILIEWLRQHEPNLEARSFVDAGPMMDKAWAVRAGIGWLGKHTNVITRSHGSWIFLGEVLVNLELEFDQEIVPDYCGTCTRCLDACPTGAIVQPYLVDGTKCISYGTIELKDAELPPVIGNNLKNWIFGCDICQDVCPWNRFSQETTEERFRPREGLVAPELKELAGMTPDEFKLRFVGSPIKRSKYAGLQRNVKAVLADVAGDDRDDREGEQP